jgi:sphingomyelin phosphodiesterase
LPSNPPSPSVASSSPKSLKLLHLSDVHIDTEYHEGSESLCPSSYLCCRASESTNPIKTAGYWGSVSSCDLPERTVD